MGVGITCQACVTERSTTARFAIGPKDHSTDYKGANPNIDAQPMYHLMPNNMQHSDYELLNLQVPMTDSQHVTTQSPNTATYMHSGNMANLTVQTTVYKDGGAVQINDDCYETPALPSEAREGSNGYNISIPASAEHTDTMDLKQERPGISGSADVDEIREEPGDNLKTESDGSENMNMSMINMFAPESRRRLSGIITASHGLTDFDKIQNEVRQRYEKDEDTDDSKSESNGWESSEDNVSRRKAKEEKRLALERESNSLKLALKDYGVKVSALIDTQCDDSLNFGSDSETDSDSDPSAFDVLEPEPEAARPLSNAKNALKSKSATPKKARARRVSLIRSQSAGQWTNEELATEQQEMVSQMALLAMYHSNSSEKP